MIPNEKLTKGLYELYEYLGLTTEAIRYIELNELAKNVIETLAKTKLPTQSRIQLAHDISEVLISDKTLMKSGKIHFYARRLIAGGLLPEEEKIMDLDKLGIREKELEPNGVLDNLISLRLIRVTRKDGKYCAQLTHEGRIAYNLLFTY